MKYCQHCGAQIADEAAFCVNCGNAVGTQQAQQTQQAVQSESSTLRTVAKIFMVLGCISTAWFFLIPLCWTVPMTVHYWRAVADNRPVGTGFKVCSLLFVNLIAGILMLCDNK